MKKGKTDEEAKKICGALEAQVTGGSNFVESTLDAAGDLYLKYFFADTGFSDSLNSDGQYLSFNKEALDAKDNDAIGLPFSMLPARELSIKKDFHPWHPKGGAATWDEHIAFAKSYSPGHIVAITKDTQLTGAAIDSIKQNNGRFAIIKITDQRARDAFRNDPNLIPRQVSPGYLNFEAPNYANVKNFKWVHLAAVPRGAFGDRATVYASCLGGNECVNHLVGASVAQLDEQIRKSYCPVGAAELISSLGNSATNQPIMSVNATTEPASTGAVVSTTQTPPVAPTPKGAPISTNTGTPTKGIVRLKNSNVTPQSNQNQNQSGDPDELTKLREEFKTMNAWKEQQERREQIKRKVPKELFINKGKFDEKGYDAEVEKRLASGATDEQLEELYTMMIEKQKLINAGFSLPNQNQNTNPTPEGMQIPAAPTGGSTYQTPSDVPGAPTGASAGNDYVSKSINNLLRYTIRRS